MVPVVIPDQVLPVNKAPQVAEQTCLLPVEHRQVVIPQVEAIILLPAPPVRSPTERVARRRRLRMATEVRLLQHPKAPRRQVIQVPALLQAQVLEVVLLPPRQQLQQGVGIPKVTLRPLRLADRLVVLQVRALEVVLLLHQQLLQQGAAVPKALLHLALLPLPRIKEIATITEDKPLTGSIDLSINKKGCVY